MLSQDNQPGSGVDPSLSAVTGNLSSSTEPLADLPRGSSAVLRTAIDRLAALLWKPAAPRAAEPASSLPSTQSAPPAAASAVPGLEPILYISWRSAVSDERGESFLATTPSGAVVICEGTPQNPGKQLWSAEPAVAAAAERWLGSSVQVRTEAERALLATRSLWNLRQFDLAPRHRGTRALRDLLRQWLSPAWRPARIGLVALLLLQVLGLNAWAWQQRQALSAKRLAQEQLLRATFPQLRTVLDAPLQMQRETDALKRAEALPA